MKKKLFSMTTVLVIVVIASTLLAEDAAKPKRSDVRPPRPGVKTSRTRPSGRTQKPRNMEMMIQQRVKMIDAEISRSKKVHEAAIGELDAILKQAKAEKATKTAAMLSGLIEKKNNENKEKIKQIQKRAEDMKKRMLQNPRNDKGEGRTRDASKKKMPPRTPRTPQTRLERPTKQK